jgi:hypothetical protein
MDGQELENYVHVIEGNEFSSLYWCLPLLAMVAPQTLLFLKFGYQALNHLSRCGGHCVLRLSALLWGHPNITMANGKYDLDFDMRFISLIFSRLPAYEKLIKM